MATNLAGATCIGELNACVFRVARLDADCTPTGGADSGMVSAGLVTMTVDPEVEAGQVFEPKTGCGSIAYSIRQEDRIKRNNVSGEFVLWDPELISLLFGHDLILGAAGGPFAGKVIGHSSRLFNAAPRTGVYLEVIRQIATPTGGDCVAAGAAATPAAAGHIFGKAMLIPGSLTFENDAARLPFTGYATNNNFLANGPWNDYPGVAYIPNAPWVEVEYSLAQYNAILATVACGLAVLPAGS